MLQQNVPAFGKRFEKRISRWRNRTIPLPAVLLSVAIMAGTSFNPSTARAQTSADSTVTLRWTAPGDDGNIGTAARYDLRYRTTPISGVDTLTWWNSATVAAGLPSPSAVGSTDSVKVRGLTPAITYYFIIRAADEVPNWSGFSNVAVKTPSGDVTAPAAIADLSTTQVTGTSISIRWTAPGDDGNTGTATAYEIRYSSSLITASNWASATIATGAPTPASAGTVQTYTLNGLAGTRTYYIGIKASDEVGNTATLSNIVNATTTAPADVTPPAPVRDLSFRHGGQPTGSTAEPTSYDVLVSNDR